MRCSEPLTLVQPLQLVVRLSLSESCASPQLQQRITAELHNLGAPYLTTTSLHSRSIHPDRQRHPRHPPTPRRSPTASATSTSHCAQTDEAIDFKLYSHVPQVITHRSTSTPDFRRPSNASRPSPTLQQLRRATAAASSAGSSRNQTGSCPSTSQTTSNRFYRLSSRHFLTPAYSIPITPLEDLDGQLRNHQPQSHKNSCAATPRPPEQHPIDSQPPTQRTSAVDALEVDQLLQHFQMQPPITQQPEVIAA